MQNNVCGLNIMVDGGFPPADFAQEKSELVQRKKLELHLEKSFIRSVSGNQHRTADCLPAAASQEAPGTLARPPNPPVGAYWAAAAPDLDLGRQGSYSTHSYFSSHPGCK